MTSSSRAQVLRDDQQAIEAARQLADLAEQQASQRDRERILPWELLAEFSARGLASLTVPRAYGGPDISVAALVQVFIALAHADPALAQIPQNHFAILERLRIHGTAAQKDYFYPYFLAGDRLGNATAEPGDKRPNEHATSIRADGQGYRIHGRKVYSTGALFAQWIPVSAVDEDGRGWVVYAPRDSAGIEIIDNWDGFGQRTTASGTVVFENVYVDAITAFPSAAQVGGLDTTSSLSQLIHIAIDLGIARRALDDTSWHLKNTSNPARGSGVKNAVDDTLSLHEIGLLNLRYNAALAITEQAARRVDVARAEQDQVAVEAGMIAVIEAKILSTEVAVYATNKLFELVGTHSTLSHLNLDRHWRNARTHTLHDGVRWKYVSLGQYYLNDRIPDPWALGHPFRERTAT